MPASMPDFGMPSEEELAAERAAARRAARGAQGDEPDSSPAHAASDAAASASAVGAEHDERAGGDAPGTRASGRAARTSRSSRVAAARRRALDAARNPIVAFVAGAVVVATAFVGVPAVTAAADRGTAAQLDRLVEDAVTAIVMGDVEAALALGRPTATGADLALAQAGVAPTEPAEATCDEPRILDDVALVSCDIGVPSIGFTAPSASLRAERVDGEWTITAGLLERTSIVGAGAEIVAVAGRPVRAEDLESDQWLLPGRYDVEAEAVPFLQVGAEGGLLVLPSSGGYLELMLQPTAALRDEIREEALAYAEACLADAATAVACGIVPREGERELDVVLEPYSYSIADTTLVVPARVTGTGVPGGLTVEARVEIDGDDYAIDVIAGFGG